MYDPELLVMSRAGPPLAPAAHAPLRSRPRPRLPAVSTTPRRNHPARMFFTSPKAASMIVSMDECEMGESDDEAERFEEDEDGNILVTEREDVNSNDESDGTGTAGDASPVVSDEGDVVDAPFPEQEEEEEEVDESSDDDSGPTTRDPVWNWTDGDRY